MIDLSDDKEFEERSDYIDFSDLRIWNVENAHFSSIQKSLLNSGIKLLSGPRGTGKTHQMKIAHMSCRMDSAKPLSIFVSFSKYYYLEPILAKVPNAIQIFHTWMLSKIIVSCYDEIEEQNIKYNIFQTEDSYLNQKYIKSFIDKAEKLRADQLINDPLIPLITIARVVDIIENITFHLKRRRAVIMLDDAALSLTPEYLIEFFDIVRSLKTKSLSPKVSVYPGTTQYGPRFHVNHDAEQIQCWMSIEDDTYSAFMNSLIEKRFIQYTEDVNPEIIEIFKYASFGVPRAFITLLRSFKSDIKKKNSLKNFNTIIELQSKFIESEYLSIAEKLVQYRKVIETGKKLFRKMTDEVKEHNSGLQNEKNITIGISIESIDRYKLSDRMIRFLIEAGLLYEDTAVKFGKHYSTGENREYKRYTPHLLFLIQNKTFSVSPTVSFTEIASRIRFKNSRHPIRRTLNKLLTNNDLNGLTLDLPPCQVCGTIRLSTEQRFCHVCGHELINNSIFEECLKISVDKVPITSWQKKKIKEAGFQTVGDFIHLQDPSSELRKINQIGKYKSQQIMEEIMKIVDEFLE